MLRTLSILLLISAVAGCTSAPYKTGYDHSPSGDFYNYRTWAWISDHPMILADGAGATAAGNPLWENRIKHHIEDNLARKGLRQVDNPETADITVAFTIGAREQIKVNSYPSGYHASYGRWGRSSAWGVGYYGGTDVSVRQYTEGTLAIDIFEVKSRSPVWHGWATGNVRKNREQAEREALLEQVVNSILSQYPPA